MNQDRTIAVPLLTLFAAIVIGGGGLTAFGLFLMLGAPGWIDTGWPLAADLYWNAMLSILFFIQHSAMVRPRIRRAIERGVGANYAGSVYGIVSGALLCLIVLLWQPGPDPLIALTGLAKAAVHAGAAIALAGFVWTAKSLNAFDPLGIKTILARMKRQRPVSMPLTIRGPYRWVRHPFYTFAILLIWCHPVITPDRLLLNTMWTGWIWVGAVLEEKDLVAQFGDAYETYRQQVPRLWPVKWRR